MKAYFLILFLMFIPSEVFPQQEDASGAFVHLSKVDKPPYSENCTTLSPACTVSEIERFFLKNIIAVGSLAEMEADKNEIPVRVIIDTEGKVSWASVRGLPEAAGNQMAERLKEMPVFIPGEHEGNKANTIIDLRFPIYFSKSNASSSKVISSEKAEQQPRWKNCQKAEDPSTCTITAISDWMNRKVRTSIIKEPGSYELTAAFVIGEDGKVSRIAVLGGGDQFAPEVIKQLRKLPSLDPGKVAGEPVAVSYLLPMSFRRL